MTSERDTSTMDVKLQDVEPLVTSGAGVGSASATHVPGHVRTPSAGAGTAMQEPTLVRQNTSKEIPRHFQEMSIRLENSVKNIPASDVGMVAESYRTKKKKDKEREVEKAKAGEEPQGRDYVAHEHLLSVADLANEIEAELNVQHPRKSKGLTSADAEKRLLANGRNRLTPPKRTPEWILYLHEFINPFMILLEAAAVLCFIAYGLDQSEKTNLYLGFVLLAIVTLTCTMAHMQNRKSTKVMKGFENMLPQKCKVIREGREQIVESETIVLGDIVVLAAGDKVPADVRMVEVNDLKVDNSSLTGECEPQIRSIDSTDNNPLETGNLAFYSTLAVEGTGVALVIRTGDETLIGRIAKLSSVEKEELTTLQLEVRRFVKFISILALTLGIIFLVAGFIRGISAITNLINTIGIIVANVPEGLPATVTACLTLIARRLSSKNVFVKKLESVETLGSTTVIVSDKTGTLTMNKMSAAHVFYNWEVHSTDKASKEYLQMSEPSCASLMRVAAICSRAVYEYSEDDHDIPASEKKILGDASETAFLRLCETIMPTMEVRDKYPKLFEIPFNSKNKFQLSIHTVPDDGPENGQGHLLAFKGAPEMVFERCNFIMVKGERQPITDDIRTRLAESVEDLAALGERVLAFSQVHVPCPAGEARVYSSDSKNYPMDGYTFLGLISLIDPPKPGVPDAISLCRTAGIKVIMATGDHPLTAKAIARQIGLVTFETEEKVRPGQQPKPKPEGGYRAVVITGMALKAYTDEQLEEVLKKDEIVFARTSPQQKHQIVEALQRLKHIVAVTGDGVNDSPALKQADIGIAMGIGGSDVAKEAADIILMDDNFVSIVAGIEEGRLIFDNLRKSIAYTLSHLFPELFPFIINLITGCPLMISAILILCIDLGTEMAPAVSLAYESAELNIMNRKPRDAATEHLVNIQTLVYSYFFMGVMETAPAIACFFYIMKENGFDAGFVIKDSSDFTVDANTILSNGVAYTRSEQLDILREAQTAYFAAIVMMQMMNLIACKTRLSSVFVHGFANKHITKAIGISSVILVLIVFVPPFNTVFTSKMPIPGYFWLIPLPFLAFGFVVTEIRKYFSRVLPTSSFYHKIFTW
eukprot:Opistho-2@10843